MKPNPDRQALIDQALVRLRQKLEEQLPDDNATLDQIEEALGDLGEDFVVDLQQRVLRQRSKKARDNQIDCACGGRARYKGQQKRSIVTRHGVLVWKRACYQCAACKRRFAPLDTSLGLDAGFATRSVRKWVAHLGAHLPFEQSVATLEYLTGVTLSVASARRIVVCIGAALSRHEKQQSQLHQQGSLPDKKTVCPRRLYVGMDGVYVPLRDAFKHDKSQGDLSCRYGECKIGVVYETFRDKTGRDVRVSQRAYCASLTDVDTFAPLVATLAHRHGHHAAKQVVVLGDGAPWIWQIAGKQFPGAVQILDFFHACEHLALIAAARFGNDAAASTAWQTQCQAHLKSNGVALVLQEIAAWKPRRAAQKEIRRKGLLYFGENAHRMRYQTYLEAGMQIGSGVVEATCKHLVAQRMDQAGMHWRQETAEAVVCLRAAALSTFPTDLTPFCGMPH